MATPTSQVKVKRIQRIRLDPEVARSLPRRQVAWLVMGSPSNHSHRKNAPSGLCIRKGRPSRRLRNASTADFARAW